MTPDEHRQVVVTASTQCGCTSGDCWRGRCESCRGWLTKHDWTRAAALASALDALKDHKCSEGSR